MTKPMTPARAAMLARRREVVRGIAQTAAVVVLTALFVGVPSITAAIH